MHIQREQVIACGLVQRSMGPHGGRPGRGDRSQADRRVGYRIALAAGWYVGQAGFVTVLVAGASGFVGRRLCPALVEAGVVVRAMTRRPDRYRGAGTPVRADAADAASVRAALEGCEAAYYLVHSLASADF